MLVAKNGDVLILTKPLGIGIGVEAIDRKVVTPQFTQIIGEYMVQFNAAVYDLCQRESESVHAVVAVNCRGLLGHVFDICRAGRVRSEIQLEQVPLISGVASLAEREIVPTAAYDNLNAYSKFVRFDRSIPKSARLVLADPQMNGGLLIAVAPSAVNRLMRALARRRRDGFAIGTIHRGRPRVDIS